MSIKEKINQCLLKGIISFVNIGQALSYDRIIIYCKFNINWDKMLASVHFASGKRSLEIFYSSKH